MYFKNNEEDYIKTVFSLSEAFGSASENQISRDLNVSMATVSEYLSKLYEKKLINKNNRNITLTETGYKMAVPVILKHRISEVFAIKMLEVPWEESHMAVMDIEHTIDDKYFNNFVKHLGNPKTCPHGNPVNCNYITDDRPIRDIENGKHKINRIVYEDSFLLKQMADLQMLPGTIIEIYRESDIRIVNQNGEFTLSPALELAIRVN
ncbi:MAG: metal-dependent transcriptional regulator [Ferroplasma sp.]